ncbi:MAG: RNA polymerase sigma factor [Bacteroidota bacterium]
MAASDESLMAQYQTGDASAFQELVLRHERPLWTFLRRFVGDAATAEDLLQEVFLRVVRAAGEWQREAKFSTWLYTIARNLCTDQARRAVHRRAASLDAPARPMEDEGSGPVLADRIAGGGGGAGGGLAQAEGAAMDRQLAVEIDRAVGALPPDQREVFLMREVMDMSFADIARAVGATEPTVKSRMRYALEKLRQALAGFHDAPVVSRQRGA